MSRQARGVAPGPSGPWILAIDTGTSRIVVAAGRADGTTIRSLAWPAGHRHGEQLLAGIEQLLKEAGLLRADLVGVVVGTGPGAFTGLRVGLATAKTLAHAMGLPIAGIGTAAALMRAAASSDATPPGDPTGPVRGSTAAVLLPAGPHDRVLVRGDAAPELLPGGVDPGLDTAAKLIAVDLEGRAPEAAIERGLAALERLGPALIELGAKRLESGTGDDVERLVPEYVTLPRGVRASVGEIEWSHDRP